MSIHWQLLIYKKFYLVGRNIFYLLQQKLKNNTSIPVLS